MEKNIKIALAGNPNCGKTTLFNALTGSNQFVGNWPGVTVEKKEGKLKKFDGVTVVDLPGIYSLSPYTLEEVVARNFLLGERPDAILNIIDGTNLERNLYLTTQLTELGIPVVVAVNMMDIVRKNGDVINIKELSRQLGCKVMEISALKGDGVSEAAAAAVDAAKNGKTIPMHSFSGVVEHAIAHIEEAVLHELPEEQQRWYAIKIFEHDDKVLAKLAIKPEIMQHIDADIKAAEDELDDDAESIITNERYLYIASIIKACYKKKNAGKLTASDKIDKIVTNRWLGLPIFAVVMFLVYWVAMVAVGAPATDWANDGVFGDGWHLLGIGSADYNDTNDEYTAAIQAVSAFLGEDVDVEADDFDADALLADMKALQTTDKTATVDVEDEETLAINTMTAYYDALPEGADKMDDVVQMTYVDAVAYLEENGFDAPDPADYGVWVPGIPVLVGNGLDAANAAPWLSGLINDGIVAGVGAVLGFVPQMLVLFLMLAFLEACGYMARIAFVLDRVFRKFGLSGKSFIPMLIGVGCGVPGVMASRNENFDLDMRFFNGYFSNERLTDLDPEAVSTVITEHDLTVIADQLNDSMGFMFPLMCGFSLALYMLLVYLLSKMIIEKNAQSISMLKILGYTPREISSLYNSATAIAVGVSLIVTIPFSALIMKWLFYYYMHEMSGWVSFYIAPWIWPAMLGLGAAAYFIVHLIQTKRLGKIPLAQALKNME